MSENITTKLIPYCFFNERFQLHVAENSQPQPIKAGESIFKQGDSAENVFFLLKGKVKLLLNNGKENLRGPSGLAFSQGYDQHSLSAEAAENSLILRVDLSPEQQDTLLCWEFIFQYFENAPWILSIKQCEMFDHISPAKLLMLCQGFKEKKAEANEIIIKENDYERLFYVLTEGTANVYQGTVDENAKSLSTLEPLQTFGEASLMEDLPRTATIRMNEAGSLMSLDATNLDKIQQQSIPSSTFLNRAQLKECLKDESARILDIRPEKESKVTPLKGAQLAPVELSTKLLHAIDSSTKYIIYSPYEQLNKLIYFLLREKNKNISILK